MEKHKPPKVAANKRGHRGPDKAKRKKREDKPIRVSAFDNPVNVTKKFRVDASQKAQLWEEIIKLSERLKREYKEGKA